MTDVFRKDRVAETSSGTPSTSLGVTTVSLSGTAVTVGSRLMRTFLAGGAANGNTVDVHIEQISDSIKWITVRGTFNTGSPNTVTYNVADIIDGSAGAATNPSWSGTVNVGVEPIALGSLNGDLAAGGIITGAGTYVDSTHCGKSAGLAYIPSLNRLVQHAAPSNLAPTLSGSTLHVRHIYSFVSSGTFTLEDSATAPAALSTPWGNVMIKTGDPSRRYEYSIGVSASNTILPFLMTDLGGGHAEMRYTSSNAGNAPYRVMASFASSSYILQNLSTIIPPSVAYEMGGLLQVSTSGGGLAHFSTDNANTNAGAFVAPNVTGFAGGYLRVKLIPATPSVYAKVTGTSPDLYFDLIDYKFLR